jgi:hypothetical protein
VIPDCQIRPDDDPEYLSWVGKYIVHKKPDVVVCLGDFADMHSLSSYDQGKKAGEGARYQLDITAARNAMAHLVAPLFEYNRQQAKNKKRGYRPRMVLTLGNHENRINRYVNDYPQLSDYLSTDNLGYQDYGWEVYPFLETVEIDGITYSHFFPRGPNGRVMQTHRGAPSARAQVQRNGGSCTAGHLQGIDFAILNTGYGMRYGLIAGSCYLHDEDYLSPQETDYWRGIIMKNEVRNGKYDIMPVSLNYLERKYG